MFYLETSRIINKNVAKFCMLPLMLKNCLIKINVRIFDETFIGRYLDGRMYKNY